MNISLVRVLDIKDGQASLRTERSYTGYEPAADMTVPLSRISFGYQFFPGASSS